MEARHACGSYCVSRLDVSCGGVLGWRVAALAFANVRLSQSGCALTPTPTFGPQRPLSEHTQLTSPTHPSIAPHSSAEPTPTASFFHPGRLRSSASPTPAPVLPLLLRFSLPYPCTCVIVLCRLVDSRLAWACCYIRSEPFPPAPAPRHSQPSRALCIITYCLVLALVVLGFFVLYPF